MRGDAEYILLGLWKPAGENSVVLGPIVSIFAFLTRARTGGSPGDEKKKDPLKTGTEDGGWRSVDPTGLLTGADFIPLNSSEGPHSSSGNAFDSHLCYPSPPVRRSRTRTLHCAALPVL